MRHRVALAGIYHESNTFLKEKTTLDNFQEGHLLYGEEIRDEYSGAFHEIGGMLQVLDELEIEVVPLIFAESTPGGVVAADALDYLFKLMAKSLIDNGPFDGILVVPHGAAVSENEPDMDGWWLQKIRSIMGSGTPIIGTLDPHANVSQSMVNATNALVAYKTNPHIDQRETGKVAAKLMADTLDNKIQPVQYFYQPQATISIEKQYTNASPCKELYKYVEQISKEDHILSISILLGFPYADVKEMGSGFLVITDNDKQLAESYAKRLGDYLWQKRKEFIGEKLSVRQAISSLEDLAKPVLLLDMGDNVGGGGPGDSTFILDALEASGKWTSFVCIYDPESVAQASECDLENKIWMKIGGKTDDRHGDPVHTKVTVKNVTEGVFKETQPRHGGQVNFNMGEIAIVETLNATTIMLTSLRTVPFSLNQITAFGLNPANCDVIVAKGVHAPIAAYETVCKNIIRVNTDGITKADMTLLSYSNRRKPLYPFEN